MVVDSVVFLIPSPIVVFLWGAYIPKHPPYKISLKRKKSPAKSECDIHLMAFSVLEPSDPSCLVKSTGPPEERHWLKNVTASSAGFPRGVAKLGGERRSCK